MMTKYETIFNSPKSTINVDRTWDRHREGNDRENDRFEFTLQNCFGLVLEVGAGDGYCAYLISKVRCVSGVVALEIQDNALAKIEENFQGLPESHRVVIKKGAIENFTTNVRYDTVHCGHTLEHVLDFEKSLQALHAIDCNNFILSVPIRGGISKQHLREWKSGAEFITDISPYFKVIDAKEYPRSRGRSSLVVKCKRKYNG